jgi:uncharacterized repeat protein (TIGR01451 family)
LKGDTVIVDTGFGFSSLDSALLINNGGSRLYSKQPLDSINIKIPFQNYSNWAQSDSFSILAFVRKLSGTDSLIVPNKMALTVVTDTTTLYGVAPSQVSKNDSAYCKVLRSSGAIDTFMIKVKLPNADTAMSGDTAWVKIVMKGRHCLGTNDNWPHMVSTGVGTFTLDSTAAVAGGVPFLYRHRCNGGVEDTLWDYGDTQSDSFRIIIRAALLRIAKKTTVGGKLPGDTLTYGVYYANKGTDTTRDTAFIVDILPKYVSFVDTISNAPGQAGLSIKTYVQYNGAWLNHIPSKATVAGVDSLFRITGVRYAVAPGIPKWQGPGAGEGGANSVTADESTVVDAGLIKYKVRIR